MTPEYVFLYGTLLSGLPAPAQRPDLRGRLVWVGARAVHGRLCDAGAYPALVAGTDLVQGELWRLCDAGALALLDDWEEYRPGRPADSLYVRTTIHTTRGERAWCYRWNGPRDLPVITSHSWRAWVLAREAARRDIVPDS